MDYQVLATSSIQSMKDPSIVSNQASLSDISSYAQAQRHAQQSANSPTANNSVAPTEGTESVKAADQNGNVGSSSLLQVLSVFGSLEEQKTGLGAMSAQFGNGVSEMAPSEIFMLTMHAQKFMFHCTLTSNVANRSSEAVQQLFRQQS